MRWNGLLPGDTIICPATGLPEKVTRRPEKRPGGRVFVRTDRHDHLHPAQEDVRTPHDPCPC